MLAGDVFYAPEVAARVLPRLAGLAAQGALVLVGDPGRRDLPQDGLAPLAHYDLPDMGDPLGRLRRTRIYRLTSPATARPATA